MTYPAIPYASVNSTIYETLGNQSGGFESYDATNAYYYEGFFLSNSTPGVPVSISLCSDSFDTWLAVVNLDSGEVVAYDNDGGGGTNSALSFTPVYGDNYAVFVSSAGHNATGSYALSVA